MQKARGIGGFFFRAQDPDKMAEWYEKHLGVSRVPADYDTSPWQQSAGACVFAPFPADSDFFGTKEHHFMLNFRVDDLDSMVTQLEQSGIEVDVDAEIYPNGKFATVEDPEGNRIQLWEPSEAG